MAISTVSSMGRLEIEWTRNGEWMETGIESLDPDWRGTDSQGHEHYYEDHAYPTLEYIVDAWHWCDGREGLYSHDPHKAVDESHYECRQCREVVEPGRLPPWHRIYIPGRVEITGRGVSTDGWHLEVSLTEEQANELASADEATQQAFIDAVPHSDAWWSGERRSF